MVKLSVDSVSFERSIVLDLYLAFANTNQSMVYYSVTCANI